jgi:hypothetical protein
MINRSTIHHGEFWRRAWRLTNADGGQLDLHGAHLVLTISDYRGSAPALTLKATLGQIQIDHAAGIARVAMPTARLPLGAYQAVLNITLADGTQRAEPPQALIIQ